jgi:hypothetical protein
MPTLDRAIPLTLLVLLFQPLIGSAIDLQPNDVVAPLPDKNYLMLSYVNTENTNFYRNGSVVSAPPIYKNPVIDSNSAILRGTRTYSISDLPAVSYVQLPYTTTRPAGSLSGYPRDSGIGDLTIATAIWPYSNRETRTYLGIAGYLITPTGSYSSQQPFNVSENRFKSDLQMGFQKPITDSVDGMIAVDTMWFGGNSQCAIACSKILAANSPIVPLTQKPLTTTQLGPIYNINQIFTVGASYFYVAGGATAVNNVYQNNVINTQRFLLSGLAHTSIGRLSLQYGRDMEIKNGFYQPRVLAVRFAKEF